MNVYYPSDTLEIRHNTKEYCKKRRNMHSYLKETSSISNLHWETRILNDEHVKESKKRAAREEFVFLMYNDVLAYLIKGHFKESSKIESLRSPAKLSQDLEEQIIEENNVSDFNKRKVITEENCEQDMYTLTDNSEQNEMTHVEESSVDSSQSQMMNITFVNDNTYTGCVDGQMLGGRGEYWWKNGELYKGHLKENQMSDRGTLEWNNGCWYDGEFFNGYRHGKGLVVNPNNHFMYTGDWQFGRKHGKGYCCRGNNDSYEGNWSTDQMDGIGTRNYPNGEQYIGQWKNNIRHGIGMMIWRNGDVYYGEWVNGYMHGYGEYVWKNSAHPSQRISYVGSWHQGVRHGEGSLMLGSVNYPEHHRSWENDTNKNDSVILTEIPDDEDENRKERET